MIRRAPHAVIIGAGPAGLSAAVCLQRRGVPFTLLERGETALAALKLVDPEMALLSPKRLSRLPGMRFPDSLPTYPLFRDVVAAFERYREEHGVALRTGAQVTRVSPTPDGFTVAYECEGKTDAVEATHLVNATGILSHPRLPDFDPAELSVPWKHSRDVRGDDLSRSRRLLVVGAGASAADVLEKWLALRREDDRTWMSVRSRLWGVANPVCGVDLHYLAYYPEQAPSWIAGWRGGRLVEPMNLRKIRRGLKAGWITRAPAVERLAGDRVRFTSGEEQAVDLVVFATGYCYRTPHLEELIERDPDGRPRVCCGESPRTRRLYLLGFRFGRTFASPYLRGIAKDADYTARRIAAGK